MTSLASHRIVARRRPGAIMLLWACRLLAATLIAAPVANALGSTGLGHLPRADAALFAPGGAYLLEAVRHSYPQLLTALRYSVWLAVLLGLLTLIPVCALMVALCHGGRLRLDAWAARTATCLPPVILVTCLSVIGQAATMLVAAAGILALLEPGSAALTEPGAIWQPLSVAALAAAAVLAIGVLADLARAAVIRNGVGAAAALGQALRAALRSPTRVLVDWLTPALWGVVVVACAAACVQQVGVAHPGEWRLLVVGLVHQVAAVALVALRANWLARALATVSWPPTQARARTASRYTSR